MDLPDYITVDMIRDLLANFTSFTLTDGIIFGVVGLLMMVGSLALRIFPHMHIHRVFSSNTTSQPKASVESATKESPAHEPEETKPEETDGSFESQWQKELTIMDPDQQYEDDGEETKE